MFERVYMVWGVLSDEDKERQLYSQVLVAYL